MLMNHKNFHFTQISDNTNDVIFLKSPKTIIFGSFLTIFGQFCPMGIFSNPKNLALSHKAIYGPPTPRSVSEKTNYPIPTKPMDRQKDRQKDGQTLFLIGPFLLGLGVQKELMLLYLL